MKIIDVHDIDSVILSVRSKTNNGIRRQVLSIINDVRKRGDQALRQYENRFSGAKITSFKVTPSEFKSAYLRVNKDQVNGIKLAKKRLEKSENALQSKLNQISINVDGINIKKTFLPIESVGCYIPAGKAKYPSTVVMGLVPAKVAGVKKIIAVSPPNINGEIDPLTLVAADICGVNEFYKIGGAQAIAALAYGTESIPHVDKIVGPGGAFVTFAKSLLSNIVSIDMIAGPTELAIICDTTADPELVASDLFSQAEHSPDTMCCVITNSSKLKNQVVTIIKKKIRMLQRSMIIQESLRRNGFIAMCRTNQQMIDFVNKLAPEHVEIITKEPQELGKKITSAGLILIGKNTPSSASDYLLGSNHILPTSRFGRTRGSLSVLDFMKIQTQVKSSKITLRRISRYMKAITDAEGLPNHYEAVRERLS